MLRRVADIRNHVSEERCPTIIRMARIDKLVTTLVVTSNRRIEVQGSFESSVLIRATNIPEDDILHSHRSENQKLYIALNVWALLET
jgi:hypothetical protein